MPMIGARFFSQLESATLHADILEDQLARELDNGRLFRLLSKLGTIIDRPE
jgi:PAB-dependent poly(A)-specific ribonuclease subunit 3